MYEIFGKGGISVQLGINDALYEEDKKQNKDHVATPRWVVENIYQSINIKQFKNIWFPFNNYDSHFKLKADELNLKYKATHIFDDLGNDFFTTLPLKIVIC